MCEKLLQIFQGIDAHKPKFQNRHTDKIAKLNVCGCRLENTPVSDTIMLAKPMIGIRPLGTIILSWSYHDNIDRSDLGAPKQRLYIELLNGLNFRA